MSDERPSLWDFWKDPDPRTRRLIWVVIAGFAVAMFFRWLF